MNTAKFPERIIGREALIQAPSHIRARCPGATCILVVCDDNTWLAAGEKLRSMFDNSFALSLHTLGRFGKPTLEAAQQVAALAQEQDVLLAVGAGSVNDVTKYAAHVAQKPYFCVVTGASMNGYSSTTASLLEDGLKQSHPATPPYTVIADLDVLIAAPRRMMRAGLGDTLCRSTVEVDMLLSHYLLDTTYPKSLFEKLRVHEPTLIAGATAAREGDAEFMTTLMHALLDAGDAMTEFGSSAIASQGEHMIAHTLELMYGAEMHGILHGELIALATLTMSRLQHKLLLSLPTLRSLVREEKLFLRSFGKKLCRPLYEAYQKKILPADSIQSLEHKLQLHWESIKTDITKISLAPNTLERVFMQIGLAVRSKDLGIDEERYRNACTYAYLARERLGALDLAAMGDKRVM